MSRLNRDPIARNVGRAFKHPALRTTGKALPYMGAALSIFGNATEEGNDTSDVVTESTVEIGVGLAAGVATTAVCAAATGGLCLVAGAGIALASTAVADDLGEVASDAVDGISDTVGGWFD